MKKIVLYLSLCGFILAGCNKNEPVNELDGDHEITVFLSSESILTSQLKSGVVGNEGTINRVVLFGFDVNNAFVAGNKWIISGTPNPTGNQLTVSRKVTTIWAIANPVDVAMENEPTNITNLKTRIANYPANNRPVSPFLMSGKGTVTNWNATIQLYFAVAKVEIIPQGDGFVMTSVTVNTTPDRVYVFDENVFDKITPLPAPSLPTGVSRVNYPAVNAPQASWIFYVAENNATTSGSNTTKFVINGTIDGKAISPGFNLELKQDASIIPIRRNIYYKVTVGPKEDGIGIITVKTPDWTDINTDLQIIP